MSHLRRWGGIFAACPALTRWANCLPAGRCYEKRGICHPSTAKTALWLGGEVEMAEEAVFGGEDVDGGEEVLQAVVGGGAFGGEQVGFAFFAGVVPAL